MSKTTVALPSKYCQFVKLDFGSHHRVEMLVAAQNYLQKRFVGLAELSDRVVQRQLWQQMCFCEQAETEQSYLAEVCLRCYISHQIYQVCFDLETKFGRRNGFTCQDLLPLVLDDELLLATKSTPNISYQSLASTILKTFDPAKGSLNTWVNRYVKQHPELKRFLLQHGVFLVSDWALLNDTNYKELQRILTDMYGLAAVEIQQKCELLVSYHTVYCEDRLQQRLTNSTLPCQQPTAEQLTRIANDLHGHTSRRMSTELILSHLKAIASLLRRYRIAAQGGAVASVSFDKPEIQLMVEHSQITPEDAEQNEFIKLYQEQFLESLDEAISQAIEDNIQKFQRQRISQQQSYITALHLFHCQGQSMTQIAPQIHLKKQFEVTRLLKINELRTDIRQKLLLIWHSKVIELVKQFTDWKRLQNLDKQVEAILNEEISSIIQEAESEVKTPLRNQPLRSLFARHLCRYLNSRSS